MRWVLAGIACELHSTNGRLLDRARAVLRASPPDDASRAAEPTIVWRVTPPLHDGELESGANAAAITPLMSGNGTPPVGEPTDWTVRQEAGGQQAWLCRDADAAVRVVEYGTVASVIEDGHGVVTLHGAILSRGGQGVILLGPGEAGKSTLAMALWMAGWTLHGDDTVVLAGDGLHANALPRRASLRHGSRELLGEVLWQRILASASCSATTEGYLFHPSDVEARPGADGLVRPSAVLFLARRGIRASAGQPQRMTGAEALLAMLPYSNIVRTRGTAEALQRLQPLAGAVPVFDLARGPLPDMVRAVERCAG